MQYNSELHANVAKRLQERAAAERDPEQKALLQEQARRFEMLASRKSQIQIRQ